MSENIFDVAPDTDIVTIDENVDYVEQLVGDGKKFRDVSSLARGKYEADLTIEVLKKKLDELNKELNIRMTLETFADQLKSKDNPQPKEDVTPQGDDRPAALDDSTLEAKLQELLSRRESQQKAETNLEQVTRVLKEQFGDQAQQVINHKAKELNVSPKYLEDIARQSSTAFFRLTGVTPEQTPEGPVVAKNGVNTFAPTTSSGLKNQAYYDKMKRTDPKKYFSQETTVEMIKSRAQLGDKFYQ